MYDENQLVKVKWNTSNREWLESRGYKYTFRYDTVEIKAKDLLPTSKAKVIATCDYCGKQYSTAIANIVNGLNIYNKCACQKCAQKKAHDIVDRKYNDYYYNEIQKICVENNYKLLSQKEEFKTAHTKIRYICTKHGIQETPIYNMINLGSRCRKCAWESNGNKCKYSTEEVINKISSYYGNKLLNPYEYKDSNVNNLIIKCGICGKEYSVSLNNYMRYEGKKCSHCFHIRSSAEIRIAKFLDENFIKYEREKKFIDCKDKRSLPFDFFLPDYNLIIEFDGQHHFYQTYTKEHFEYTVKHDQIKNNFCKSKGINLLRIPYYDGNDIETIITQKINELKKNIA